jgi:hypothetical protein
MEWIHHRFANQSIGSLIIKETVVHARVYLILSLGCQQLQQIQISGHLKQLPS